MFLGQSGDIDGLFAFHIDHVISKSRRSSRKEVVHAVSLIIYRAIWDVEKTLRKAKRVFVIKEITKVKTHKSISERINRCVMTEIGGSVRIFGKILQSEKPRSDRGGLNLFSMHDMN